MFVATPVMGFTAVEPLMLAPDITVRRATDEEVSAMLEIGALNLGGRQNSTQVYTIQVPDAARWIVAMDHSRRRRFGSNGQEEDEPNLSRLKEAAGAWLATLRILTPAQVRLGPTLTTQLLGGIISGGSLNGDAREFLLRGTTRRQLRRTTLRHLLGSLNRSSAAEPDSSVLRTAFIGSARRQRAAASPIGSSTWPSRWSRCSPTAEIQSVTR
jgi:hypothetical protein